MKLLKTLGLAAVISAAMMAPAGAASATVLTSPAGTEYTGTLNLTGNGSQLLEASVFNVTCTVASMGGTVTTNSSFASGSNINMWLFGCGEALVTVLFPGSFEVTSLGQMRLAGTEITFSKSGISCIYGSLGSPFTLGTIAGGTTASLAVSASVPKRGGSFLCPSSAKWTGKFTVTTPDTLLIN